MGTRTGVHYYNYGSQVLWKYATLRCDFKGEMYLYNSANNNLCAMLCINTGVYSYTKSYYYYGVFLFHTVNHKMFATNNFREFRE